MMKINGTSNKMVLSIILWWLMFSLQLNGSFSSILVSAFIAPKHFWYYLDFQSFNFERTWSICFVCHMLPVSMQCIVYFLLPLRISITFIYLFLAKCFSYVLHVLSSLRLHLICVMRLYRHFTNKDPGSINQLDSQYTSNFFQFQLIHWLVLNVK